MVESRCTHDELSFRPGRHGTIHVRCMQCRRYVTMELDRQDEMSTFLARRRITAVWEIRERLVEQKDKRRTQ